MVGENRCELAHAQPDSRERQRHDRSDRLTQRATLRARSTAVRERHHVRAGPGRGAGAATRPATVGGFTQSSATSVTSSTGSTAAAFACTCSFTTTTATATIASGASASADATHTNATGHGAARAARASSVSAGAASAGASFTCGAYASDTSLLV